MSSVMQSNVSPVCFILMLPCPPVVIVPFPQSYPCPFSLSHQRDVATDVKGDRAAPVKLTRECINHSRVNVVLSAVHFKVFF